MNALLNRAIFIWRSGRPIPLTLATKLMAQGFDVEALEQQFRN